MQNASKTTYTNDTKANNAVHTRTSSTILWKTFDTSNYPLIGLLWLFWECSASLFILYLFLFFSLAISLCPSVSTSSFLALDQRSVAFSGVHWSLAWWNHPFSNTCQEPRIYSAQPRDHYLYPAAFGISYMNHWETAFETIWNSGSQVIRCSEISFFSSFGG